MATFGNGEPQVVAICCESKSHIMLKYGSLYLVQMSGSDRGSCYVRKNQSGWIEKKTEEVGEGFVCLKQGEMPT